LSAHTELQLIAVEGNSQFKLLTHDELVMGHANGLIEDEEAQLE
jgi:hypothetical protein